MFPFSRKSPPETPAAAEPAAPAQPPSKHRLDDLTGGAFSAATSGDRAARIREWLATNPSQEQLQDVFKALSSRDKGAARPIRDRLDELKRVKGQAQLAEEWSQRAQALLSATRLNIADAMAWQRDAARAGAPLSREPLASLRAQLADRVKVVEDLQNQAMVQREASVLLAQRIELLTTKSWTDAAVAREALARDVDAWRAQVAALVAQADWTNVDARYPSQLDAAGAQLQAVWDAFQAALTVAEAAAASPQAPLPDVPTWADELRLARGEAVPAAPATGKDETPKPDPEARAKANARIEKAAVSLDAAVKIGQGRAIASAAHTLRQALKEVAKRADEAVLARAHVSLAAAQELEGWQKWRADQLREELVAKAEALLKPLEAQAPTVTEAAPQRPMPPGEAVADETKPAEPGDAAQASASSGAVEAEPPASDAASMTPAETRAASEPVAAAPTESAKADSADAAERVKAQWQPTLTGRKLQETLRQLREQWKATDQGGVPNHALWKRFDRACNRAHVFVEDWLAQVRAESARHRAERQSLIAELQAWGQTHVQAATGGQPVDWKAINRQLHQFAERWRSAGHLSEKAYAELQAKWKQALNDASAPLQAARKESLARRHAMIEEARLLGSAPTLRIDAIKALQARWQAEAQAVPIERKQEQRLWDAFRKPIDEAFQRKTLERKQQATALSARDQAVLEAAREVEAATQSGDAQRIRAALAALEEAQRREVSASTDAGNSPAAPTGEEAPAVPAQPAARPVVAMRGDDRPGAKRPEALARDPRHGRDGREGRPRQGAGRDAGRERPGTHRPDRGPRLSDAAFRAQREATEQAQAALRKLAAQAHGETIAQLLSAWQQRDAQAVPTAADLGKAVTGAVRAKWVGAIAQTPAADAVRAQALLRLEIAADVPTPAEQLADRRALQLQLLTRRHEPSPEATWADDVATVLSAPHAEADARRLQQALKPLLGGRQR